MTINTLDSEKIKVNSPDNTLKPSFDIEKKILMRVSEEESGVKKKNSVDI